MLAIATNIPVLLMTAFVLQGHIFTPHANHIPVRVTCLYGDLCPLPQVPVRSGRSGSGFGGSGSGDPLTDPPFPDTVPKPALQTRREPRASERAIAPASASPSVVFLISVNHLKTSGNSDARSHAHSAIHHDDWQLSALLWLARALRLQPRSETPNEIFYLTVISTNGQFSFFLVPADEGRFMFYIQWVFGFGFISLYDSSGKSHLHNYYLVSYEHICVSVVFFYSEASGDQ